MSFICVLIQLLEQPCSISDIQRQLHILILPLQPRGVCLARSLLLSIQSLLCVRNIAPESPRPDFLPEHLIQFSCSSTRRVGHEEERDDDERSGYTGKEEGGLETPIGSRGVEHVWHTGVEDQSEANTTAGSHTGSLGSKSGGTSLADIGPAEVAQESGTKSPEERECELRRWYQYAHRDG